MKQASMESSLTVFKEAGLSRIVWDNAPSHKATVLRDPERNLPQISFLPPYSPELNPAERVFQEVRRHVEGRIWPDIDAKMKAVEAFLMELSSDAERVKQLACWQWIRESLQRLPANSSEPSEQVACT